jgi:hypothetical protein
MPLSSLWANGWSRLSESWTQSRGVYPRLPGPSLPAIGVPRKPRSLILFAWLVGVAVFITLLHQTWGPTIFNLAPSLPTDYIAQIRAHEHQLSHQINSTAVNGRFVFFMSQHHWGVGFNNLWEEFILLSEIAYRADRAYVFRDVVSVGWMMGSRSDS